MTIRRNMALALAGVLALTMAGTGPALAHDRRIKIHVHDHVHDYDKHHKKHRSSRRKHKHEDDWAWFLAAGIGLIALNEILTYNDGRRDDDRQASTTRRHDPPHGRGSSLHPGSHYHEPGYYRPLSAGHHHTRNAQVRLPGHCLQPVHEYMNDRHWFPTRCLQHVPSVGALPAACHESVQRRGSWFDGYDAPCLLRHGYRIAHLK